MYNNEKIYKIIRGRFIFSVMCFVILDAVLCILTISLIRKITSIMDKYYYIIVAVFAMYFLITISIYYKNYLIDKKSKLKWLMIKFESLNKNANNREKYEIIKSTSVYDKIDITAKIKSNLGFEFLFPLIITILTFLLTIMIYNKDFIVVDKDRYKNELEKYKIEIQVMELRAEEERMIYDNMLKENRETYVFYIGSIFLFATIPMLYYIGSAHHIKKQHIYLLSLIEQIY